MIAFQHEICLYSLAGDVSEVNNDSVFGLQPTSFPGLGKERKKESGNEVKFALPLGLKIDTPGIRAFRIVTY